MISALFAKIDSLILSNKGLTDKYDAAIKEPREKRVSNINSDTDLKLQTEVISMKNEIADLRKASEEASKREKQLLKCKIDNENKIRALEIEAETEESSENGTITKLMKNCEDLREVEAKLRTELSTKNDKIESLQADLDELKVSKEIAIEQVQKALEAMKKSENAVNERTMEALHLASSLFDKEEQLRSTQASTCVLTVATLVLSDVVEGDSVNINCRLGKDIAETPKLDNSQMTVEQKRQKVDGDKSVANEHDNQLRTPHFTESQLMNNWEDVLHTTVNEDMCRKVDYKDAFGGEKRSMENAVGVGKRRIEHEIQSGLQRPAKVNESVLLAEELKTQKILEAQKIILSRYRKVSNVMARKLSSFRKGKTLSRKKRRLRE